MTLPSYRRTRGPFVTLYRSLKGVETEIGCAFGESADIYIDSVQQQDLLMMAESADCSTKLATQDTEMIIPNLPKLESIPASIQAEALRVAKSPERIWSKVFVNYDTDFNEWFVNPFICDLLEDGAVTVAMVDESTKTLVHILDVA